MLPVHVKQHCRAKVHWPLWPHTKIQGYRLQLCTPLNILYIDAQRNKKVSLITAPKATELSLFILLLLEKRPTTMKDTTFKNFCSHDPRGTSEHLSSIIECRACLRVCGWATITSVSGSRLLVFGLRSLLLFLEWFFIYLSQGRCFFFFFCLALILRST